MLNDIKTNKMTQDSVQTDQNQISNHQKHHDNSNNTSVLKAQFKFTK